MSVHTPGPWFVLGLLVAPDAEPLATVALIHDQPGHAEAQANARLIAAAPELLASLRKTLAAANELHGQGIGCPDCHPDHEDTGADCPMLLEAEAAIAKAGRR